MEYNKPFLAVLVAVFLTFQGCSKKLTFDQTIHHKIQFLDSLRKCEGKQTTKGADIFRQLQECIFIRRFSEPMVTSIDAVPAKMTFTSSMLFYRFDKPDSFGIGRVWISNRFLNHDFHKYYEKGRGLDYQKMMADTINTFQKVYEIDVNDKLIAIYSDKLNAPFYTFKPCQKNSCAETSEKNYFSAEIMNHRINGDPGKIESLTKISVKYASSNDIISDKEFVLERFGEEKTLKLVMNDFYNYSINKDYKYTDNEAAFSWNVIRDLSLDTLRKLVSKPSDAESMVNPVVASKTKIDSGWIFVGSTTKDTARWVNQKIDVRLQLIRDLSASDSTKVKRKEFKFYQRTYLRNEPPDYDDKKEIPKGTIVNIAEPDSSRFRILDRHWVTGSNAGRKVLWLKVQLLPMQKLAAEDPKKQTQAQKG